MHYSALSYTFLLLATAFGQKLGDGALISESITQQRTHGGCILPIQPIGGSFVLNSCTGSSCNILPWSRVPHGSILKYNCNEGYLLKGGDISFCDFKGHWFFAPTCVKSCPALRLEGVDSVCSYHGENVPCESTTEPGTKASLVCKDSHKMVLGDHPVTKEITCLGDGVWSHTAFKCIPECGTALAHGHDLILNGSIVKHSSFSWHVGIYEKESGGNFVQICGGTLISPDLVISASHCFYDESVSELMNTSKFSVAAGKYYRSYHTSEHYAQTSALRSISVTEKYLGSNRNYEQDIALLRLVAPFTISNLVKPVCIDWYNTLEKTDIHSKRSGKTVWWGRTANASISAQLEEIDLPYIPFRNCLATVPEDFKSCLTADKFCAGYLNGSRPCDGESGGGLYLQFEGRWFLRGIISVGPANNGKCDKNSYIVLTNVRHFLEWIRHEYLDAGNTATTELPSGLITDEPLQDLSTENSTSGCTLPEQPTGGSFDLDLCSGGGERVSIGSVLIYRCNEGYALEGHNISVCYGNVWNPPTTCVRTCPKLESRTVEIVCKYKNEIVSCEGAILPGTKATLACKNLYEIPLADDPAYREITCLEEGVWDRSVFHCFPKCGTSEARGSPFTMNGSSYPWHVDVYRRTSIGNFQQICAGTLISPDLVLSAAHCFHDETTSEVLNARYFTVAAGKHYRSYNVAEPHAQNSVVKQIDVTGRYIGFIGKYAQDIALLRLEVPFNMTKSVKLICIDWDNEYEKEQLERGKSGKALTRGNVSPGVSGTEIEEITCPYIPDHDCFFAAPEKLKSFITADKFCAGYLNGSTLYTGDGGGGLYFQSDGLWYLRGIFSVHPAVTDSTCDSKFYSLFTNVGNFVKWIRTAYLSTRSADRSYSCRELVDTFESNRNRTGAQGSLTSATSGCLLPEQPAAGSFKLGSCNGQCDVSPGTRVPIGSFLIYSCNQDYTVNGSTVTLCYDNEWYLQPPTCVRIKYCPALRSQSVNFDCQLHGKIVPCESAILPTTTVTLACKSFFKLPFVDDPDSREITCLEDGSWDRTDFNCEPECGIHESEVDPGRFPWHVYVYESTQQRCSATLISPNLVISTAFWLIGNPYEKPNANDFVVTAGKYDFNSPYDTLESHAQKSLVSRIIMTEEYFSRDYFGNDIVLLHLQVPFEITTFVRPICIDMDRNDRVGKEFSESGTADKVVAWYYPKVKLPGNESYLTTLSYFSYEECSSRIEEEFEHFLTSNTFCTDSSKELLPTADYAYYSLAGVGYETHGHWYLLGLYNIDCWFNFDGELQEWHLFDKLGGYLDRIRATYNISA